MIQDIKYGGQHVQVEIPHTVQNDHEEREQRELLPDEAEADPDRAYIQQDVQDRVGDLDAGEPQQRALNQQREPRHAAGEQAAGADEAFYVQCH